MFRVEVFTLERERLENSYYDDWLRAMEGAIHSLRWTPGAFEAMVSQGTATVLATIKVPQEV